MLYLTRIRLDAEQEKREHLHNVYNLHQKLWKAFNVDQDHQERDFLFRVDRTSEHAKEILIQSQSEPHWDGMFPPFRIQSKSFSPKFQAGQEFFFFLRANAVVAEKRPGQKHSRKIPIRPKDYVYEGEQQPESPPQFQGWLARQGEKHGFILTEAARLGSAYAIGKKKQSGNSIKLTGQDLRGYLKVTDGAAFEQMFVTGLGRAKAFGFGMFSLMNV